LVPSYQALRSAGGPSGSSPSSDFAIRRSAAGVILSNGFDDDAEYNLGTVELSADSVNCWIRDTAEKTSGASSARAKLRAGITLANIGGAWTINMPSNFVQGDDLYVQYRQKVDAQWITNMLTRWNSGFKSLNVHGQTGSCQGSEFVILLGVDGTIRMVAYTNCGVGFQTSFVDNSLDPTCSSSGGNCLIQQGSQLADGPNVGYNCHYQNQFAGNGNGNGCLYVPSGIWMTWYMHVHLGTFGGTAGNAIETYIATGGGPYLQWQRASGWSWSGGGDSFINRVRLETYMTNLPIGGLAALADAYTWYDELIVSRQPIAAPNN
jgi:hypothetical protein